MNRLQKVSSDDFLRKFPLPLQTDSEMLVMAQVIAKVLEMRWNEAALGTIYNRIDELPEKLLDMLAYDFKVDWWDRAYGIEEKRRTLKENWKVHKMMGTKKAVETALSAIYPTTTIEEWFEYGGAPYHFRAKTTNPAIASGKQADYTRAIEIVKRLSAKMDAYIYEIPPLPIRQSPGEFSLRRFRASAAFNYERRRPVRFDGGSDFSGDLLFDQEPAGFAFPNFRLCSGLPQSQYSQTVRLGQRFSVGHEQELAALSLRIGAYPLQHRRAGGMEAGVRVVIGLRHSTCLRAALTADSWYEMDGSAAFDGTRKFNAAITKEEL